MYNFLKDNIYIYVNELQKRLINLNWLLLHYHLTCIV